MTAIVTTVCEPDDADGFIRHCEHHDKGNGPCCFCGWSSDVTASDTCTDIHLWFGLTYSNYLVLNRSILQSMPPIWQARFVALIEQLQTAVEKAGVEVADRYEVRVRGEDGRFGRDPVPHYNRGRTHIPGLGD